MKTWLTRILIVIVSLALLGAGAAWYATARNSGATIYRTTTVNRGDITATITATGTVEPEEVIDVGAQVAGQILSFGKDKTGKPIDYGSQVEEGSVLANIDPSVYAFDVASATAQLDQAKATVEHAKADLEQLKAKLYQAQRDWDRAQTLDPKSNALAATQYDAYKAAYDAAKANVDVGQATISQTQATVPQNQANLDRAKRNLAYCTILSPVKGTIIDRRVNIGQTVVSSLNAPSLFLLAKDLTRMQVWASVNEADIGNIHAGQAVTFNVDAFPNRRFKGTVNKVRFNATMTSNVVTYTVEVTTDNSDGTLLPYLTANVSFHVDKREGTLLVPNAALRWAPTDEEKISPDARELVASASAPKGNRGGGGGDRSTTQPSNGAAPTTRRSGGDRPQRGMLWIEDGQFVRPIAVRLGLTDGTNTEVIADELKDGQAVIIGETTASSGGDETKNPFAPQFRRGAGGGGGGGGGRGR
jgi:HlyD family secretion protein